MNFRDIAFQALEILAAKIIKAPESLKPSLWEVATKIENRFRLPMRTYNKVHENQHEFERILREFDQEKKDNYIRRVFGLA